MNRPITRRAWLCAGLAGSLALAARARADGDPTDNAIDDATGNATGEPTGPQPPLPTQALTVTSADGKVHRFSVEVARTPREQQVGLMFRTSVPANGGMLFVWSPPRPSQMWMENTLVPLDMVFVGEDGAISSIAENTVPQSLAIISSDGVAAATLELQGGLTEKLGITVGDKVSCKAIATS